MKPASFDYFRAEKIDDALMALAANSESQVLAGGQSLIAMMNLRLAKPGSLIDINRLTDLDYIRPEGDELAIGALTRHTTAATSTVIAEFCPLMTAAYDHIAHRAVRNRGSVGGNLCHADPSSENPAVAIASGATLVLKSAEGERRVAAEDFFLGLYETAAQQNELLTEIRIPKAPAHQGWSFQETSTRKGDFALVGIAATLDCPNGTCTDARIVAVGVGERAMRLDAAEVAITGAAMNDTGLTAAALAARDSVDPPSDFHADSEFRRDLVFSLTKRALSEAHGRCGKEG
ncbi:MAG: xanthine dehydrogenase family protein subunit M [Alphaproteobacteria bacterium]